MNISSIWTAALMAVAMCSVLLSAGEARKRYADVIMAEPSLAGYWAFEGDCRDAEGSTNGSASGGAPVFVDGPAGGKAVAFDEGRFITMGEAPGLDLPEATVELWFRPDFKTSPGYNPCLIAKRGRPNAKTRFSVHIWQDYSCMAFWNGSSVARFAPAGGELKPGQWHYLAVTNSAGGLKMYLDGVLCRLTSGGGAFALGAKKLPLNVASSTAEGQEQFQGVIDEVAIYSKALPAEAIAGHVDAMGWKERRESIAEAERKRVERERIERERREAERRENVKKFIAHKGLFDTGETKVYRDEQLTGVSLPVGGIGTGSMQFDGRGIRHIWQIFNNFKPAQVPDSFFAVRVKTPDGEPVVKALQTVSAGAFEPMQKLTFHGEYPFGWYDFGDADVPVDVGLEVFNPLIPLEAQASAIPCAIFNITVANPTGRPIEATVMATQQNAVGFIGDGNIDGRRHKAYGRNVNAVLRTDDDATYLRMTAGKPNTDRGYGDMTLMLASKECTAAANWSETQTLRADLVDGRLSGGDTAGPSPDGQTLNGALARSVKLEPGGRQTVTFALTWYFPNARHGRGQWGGSGNMYTNWWPDSLSVARDLRRDLAELTRRTRLYHETFYKTTLPRWMLDRISSQIAVIRSQTCFWTRDGYFGGWEGCNQGGGCCYGNCDHVWHYAQSHARLFPEIGRKMREQELRFQADNGGVPHRQPRSHPAFDGQCGNVLGSYREHLLSPNRKWLDAHWPKIKKSMDWLITANDKNEDGILAGAQWNTLDGNLGGNTSWLGSLYLAALAASEKMALLEDDTESAKRYRRIFEAGSKAQDETLFNDEYYIQIPDAKRQQDYINGCHIDQVLGQWWADQLCLGDIYPREHVRSALRSLIKYNFRADFHGVRQAPRKFVADDDPGMQMICWPNRDRPAGHMRYADEVMSGFEYSAAVEMIYSGLFREGFSVIRAAAIRYDGKLRKGLSEWGYSGNPFGDDECGKFYARPMSIYSALLACQGFRYDGPAGVIGFKPPRRPDDHTSFFVAAQGWGLFEQKLDGRKQVDRIEVKYGKLRISKMVFELPDGVEDVSVTVKSAGEEIAAEATVEDRELIVVPDQPVELKADGDIVVENSWRAER